MPDPRPNYETDPLVAAVARRLTALPREKGSYLEMSAYHARAAADWMEREAQGYSWAAKAVAAELDLCRATYLLHVAEEKAKAK